MLPKLFDILPKRMLNVYGSNCQLHSMPDLILPWGHIVLLIEIWFGSQLHEYQ